MNTLYVRAAGRMASDENCANHGAMAVISAKGTKKNERVRFLPHF